MRLKPEKRFFDYFLKHKVNVVSRNLWGDKYRLNIKENMFSIFNKCQFLDLTHNSPFLPIRNLFLAAQKDYRCLFIFQKMFKPYRYIVSF